MAETTLLSEMLAGAGASAVTSALLYPVDLIKIRLQSQLKRDTTGDGVSGTYSSADDGVEDEQGREKGAQQLQSNYSSAVDAAGKIYTAEGACGFYVGVVRRSKIPLSNQESARDH